MPYLANVALVLHERRFGELKHAIEVFDRPLCKRTGRK